MEHKNPTYPFDIPENYFDEFEDRLLLKMAESQLPKTTGLKVPETYFENLEQKISLPDVPGNEVKTVPVFQMRYLKYATMVAASLLIVFLIFKPQEEDLTLENIQLSVIDSYIDEGNLNLDFYDLTSYLNDGDFLSNNFELVQIPEGALENYLIDRMESDIVLEEDSNAQQ